jgi:hypothetical protein
VAAGVLGGGALITLLVVRRRRAVHAWEGRLDAAEDEVGWFARDLIPQLRRTGSSTGVLAGWSVASARIASLRDELSALVASAPDEEHRARADSMRSAVGVSQQALAALTAESAAGWEAALDTAQTPLLSALVPPSPGADQAPSDG